jgi:hypothetical protein
MSNLTNPGEQGTYSFTSVVYAASNLDYSTGQGLEQYHIYHTPTAGFVTRRIDISDIANFDASYPWPFDNTQVPINGHIKIPEGDGSFPLAVFAHGNHNAAENSTPGYLYLCELLASHGIIAATIDVNFLNGINLGENDGRAIAHLEHIKQFQIWNGQAGHPLEGKVDLSRVMIIGHSRGGEAVGHASMFNSMPEVKFEPNTPPIPLDGSQGLGPYGFNLQSVVAIAPTDGQYVPVSGQRTKIQDNYLIMHGSRDGDVSTFEGYKTYDRSHSVDLANPTQKAQGFKSLLWIHHANHNYFNSVWSQESENTLQRPQQEQIAKVYLSALAQAVLLDKLEYMDLLRNHRFGVEAGWLPTDIELVSQYQDPYRRFLQHFEESGSNIVLSSPVTGVVNTSNINVTKQSFVGTPTGILYQETQGMRLQWSVSNGVYLINLDSQTLETESFKFLVFRVGQSTESNNPQGREQDFTIEIGDGVNLVALTASSINKIIYPDQFFTPRLLIARMVMQTFRIPLEYLQSKGLNIKSLTEIRLVFNLVPSGVLYLDELQLSN